MALTRVKVLVTSCKQIPAAQIDRIINTFHTEQQVPKKDQNKVTVDNIVIVIIQLF